MNASVDPRKYAYRVAWSAEDCAFVATVAELPSLSVVADDVEEAVHELRQLVDDVVKDMVSEGEEVPEPLSTREYSGKFQVRISRDLHRKLALEAAEQHVSMNRLVNDRLASTA